MNNYLIIFSVLLSATHGFYIPKSKNLLLYNQALTDLIIPSYIKGTTSKNNEIPNILINDTHFSPVQVGSKTMPQGHNYRLGESTVYTVNDQQVNHLQNTDFLIVIQN